MKPMKPMKPMKLLDGIGAWDRFVLLSESRTLVVSDLHLGYEEAMSEAGIHLPLHQAESVLRDFEDALRKTKPGQVIINGDFKHGFSRISGQEWRVATRLIELIRKYTKRIILIKGNHDTFLALMSKKFRLPLQEKHCIGNTAIAHGDKTVTLPGKARTVIIGHEHPAVGLQRGSRRETYKCFLVGKWKGSQWKWKQSQGSRSTNLIVMPSFFAGTAGTDLLSNEPFGPYLTSRNLPSCKVYVVADKVHGFGKVYGFGTMRQLASL